MSTNTDTKVCDKIVTETECNFCVLCGEETEYDLCDECQHEAIVYSKYQEATHEH